MSTLEPRMITEEKVQAILEDLRWRMDDIRGVLMGTAFGRSNYGIDEWSTPAVNLATAMRVIDKELASMRSDK